MQSADLYGRPAARWVPEPVRPVPEEIFEGAAYAYACGIVAALAMCALAFVCWIGTLADWSALVAWWRA
jgi:hypothetical protein